MKKETSNKKSKLILIIAIALVALLAVAGVVLALTLGGGDSGEGDVPEIVKSEIYYNVDREAMLDTSTGLSLRKTESDGFVRIRFIVGGEEVTLPITDRKLVNKIDTMDFVCLKLDAEGLIVDASDASEAYVKMFDKVVVQTVEGSTVTTNTSTALNGMKKTFTVGAGVKAWDISKRITGVASGKETTLEMLDQIVVFGTDEETPYEIFMTDRYWDSDIYWVTSTRQYNSATKSSTRVADENGYWYIDLACKGEIKTYKVAKQDCINVLDSKSVNNAATGVVFDDDGAIVNLFNAGIAARGVVSANGYDITQLSDDGKTFTATRVMFGTDIGKSVTATIDENTDIINVNSTATVKGELTDKLQLNDRIVLIQRADGSVHTIFVINRMVPGPLYYNINQKWSSVNGLTRTPDENGYYVYELAADGKIKTVRTKDKAIATLMDQTSMRIFGLKLKGDIVTKYYEAVNVAGNYSFANNNFVTSTAGGVLGTVNAAGTAANGVMAADCKVFDVSGCYKEFKGEKTKVREGDQVVCYQNAVGEITHIWVLNRLVKGTSIYWNCNRYYANGETSRTPDENGYYVFNVIKLGSTKVTQLKTKDKDIASRFDKEGSTTAAALKVKGDIITAAYPAPAAIGGYYRLPGFWVLGKNETLTNGYQVIAQTGAIGNIILSGDCKVYDFSALATNKGEKTKLREGDRVWPIAGIDGNIQVLFVIERDVAGSKLAYRKNVATKDEVTGLYTFQLLINGKLGTYTTSDDEIATYINKDGYGVVAVKLKGNTITGAYGAVSAEEARGRAGGAYYDVVSIKDGQLNLKRNKVGASDVGAEATVALADNYKAYLVDPMSGDQWGSKVKLSKGDRIYGYLNNESKLEYIYVPYKCTLEGGNMRKCAHCGKVVHWESLSAGFAPAVGFVPETAHYYVPFNVNTNNMYALGHGNLAVDGVYTEVVLDLNGKTMTRVGTDGYAKSGMVKAEGGSTVIVTDYSKAQTGKMTTASGVEFTGGQALLHVPAGSKMIIEKGVFDASKALSTYTGANSGVVTAGGELVINGGTFKGWTTMGNGCVVGGWGTSKITVNGGVLQGGTANQSITGTGYGGVIASTGEVIVNGGTIKGGKAAIGGDNIALTGANATLTISGGRIDGGVQMVAGKSITLTGKPYVGEGENYGLLPGKVKIDATGLKAGAEVYVDASGVFTTEFATEEAAQAALDNAMLKNGGETTILERQGKFIAAVNDGQLHNWTDPNSLPTMGKWKLMTDVTISSSVVMSGEMYIDLNGYTIENTGKSFAIATGANKLTVDDTSSAKDGVIKSTNTTEAQFKAGVIYVDAAGEYVQMAGTLDASVVNNTYTGANSGTLTIGNGGAGFGKATINGGKILGYKSVGNGSAIGMMSKTTLTINGGEIVGNTVTGSGATGNGGTITAAGYLTINGGYIHGGSATGSGDNIDMSHASATLTINGGEIDGGIASRAHTSITITGAAKIGQGAEHGLKLASGKTADFKGLTGEVYVDADGVFTTNFASAADAQALITNGKIKLGKTVSDRVLKVDGTAIKVASPVVFDPNIVYEWNAQNAADYLGTSGTDLHKTNLPKDGKWKLVDNVTISATVSMTGNMTLDLNNKTVTMTGNTYAISTGGKTLTIDDTSSDKQGTIKTVPTANINQNASVIYVNAGAAAGRLVLNNGIIDGSAVTNTKNNVFNGAVTLGNAGTFFSSMEMNGGVIKGQKSTSTASDASGSAIGMMNGTTLVVNGGKIYGKEAASNATGDAVSAAGTTISAGKNGSITINGGELYGTNATNHGGNIYTNGNLYINGGTISGGKAYHSGVICCAGSEMIVTGGSISGGKNDRAVRGNVIDKAGGTLIIRDAADGDYATIAGGVGLRSSAALNISGKAVIDQSLNTEKEGNIFVAEGTSTNITVAGKTKSMVTGTKYSLEYKCGVINDLFAGNENTVTHGNMTNGTCDDCGNSLIQITLSKTSVELEVEGEETITAVTKPTTATVTWSSSDNAVATVVNGKITAVGGGTATITATATDGTYTSTATVAVTVNVPVDPNAWIEWNDGAKLPTEGKIKLMTDITVSAAANLTGELWLDLNGHTISSSAVVYNNNGNKLTIDDFSGKTGDQLGKIKTTATAVNVSGSVINVSAVANGAAGQLILNNGIIDGSTAVNSRNNATTGTVAVTNAAGSFSSFIMNGGIIKGQKSSSGTSGTGGSCVALHNSTSFIMNGGELIAYANKNDTDYAAPTGSCISAGGASGTNAPSSITINGGILRASRTMNHGGAIGTAGTLTINGGTIYGAKTQNSSIIWSNGTSVTINGGVLISGTTVNNPGTGAIDKQGGTITVGGNAVIGGGINIRSSAKLVFTGNAIVDSRLGAEQKFDVRINGGSVHLDSASNAAISSTNGNYKVTYDANGKINGLAAYAATAVTEGTTIPTKGAVKLTAPVTLDATLVTTGDLYIDLNGQTVTYAAAGPAIVAKHSVIITDSTAEKTGKIVNTTATMKDSASVIKIENGKSLVLMGGTLDASAVKNSYADAAGAAVTAGNNAKFVMLGGEVKGQTGTSTSSGKGGGCVAGWGNSTIVIYGGKLTAKNNGTSFPTHQAAATGTCINTAGNVFIHGGELHGTMANTHGANIYCTGNLTITGGLISGGYANNSGLINCSGASCTITGGTLVGGTAHSGSALGGASIDKAGGVLTIGGNAKIAGGVSIRGGSKLVLKDQAVIDMNMAGQTQKKFNVRIQGGTGTAIYLNDATGTAIATSVATYSVVYDAAGNIIGVTQ